MRACVRRPMKRRKMRLSRLATLAWALVLFGLAVIALHKVGRVVEVGLQIASVAYGALLGVFLLGVLTRRANQRGAMVGMAVRLWDGDLSVARDAVPWTWWVMIGTAVTFADRGMRLLGHPRPASIVCGTEDSPAERTLCAVTSREVPRLSLRGLTASVS